MNRPMRVPTLLICAALMAGQARSESLTAADREALIERLEALRDSADARVDARFRMAARAYQEAMASNQAAMDFYLKCIEKVNYEDQQKKSSEFREWKRNQADLLSDANFRLALRYQLRWLVLTLRASSEAADRVALAEEAREIVEAVHLDAEKLSPQVQTLRQAVTSTVFAKAYEIGNLDKNEWPLSPVLLEPIYSAVIFPPLRTPDRLETLRNAWIRRIQQEGIQAEVWAGNGNGRRGQPSPEARAVNSGKFSAETLPALQWEMEMDLFASGDESGAAMRMLTHIEKNLAHKSVREWGEQFRALLSPKADPASGETVDSGI